MKKGLSVVALILMSIASLHAQRNKSPAPYTIVCTVAMIGDVVQEIVGSKAHVQSLIGTGVDPHLYTPTRSDVQAILGADVVYYVGSLLEGRMSTVLRSRQKKNPHIYAMIDFALERDTSPTLAARTNNDPHIWMDVALWRLAAEGIVSSLQRYDPQNSAYYVNRANRYFQTLDRLDAYIKQTIQTIPQHKRILVTAHDAFGYFGRAYSLRVEGVQGISTESEAGLQRIQFLIGLIVQNNVQAAFVESSVNDKNIRALIEGSAVRNHSLKIGGTLYSDAMGQAGTYQGSYIGMLDHNATVIIRSLGGVAPSGGFQGRLPL